MSGTGGGFTPKNGEFREPGGGPGSSAPWRPQGRWFCRAARSRRSGARRAVGRAEVDPDEPDDLDLVAAGAGSEIVMQALANVGKPYRWGGSNPAEGFDCSGLVAHVYDDALGMKLPRTSRR